MDNAGDAQDAAPGILLRLIRDQRIAFLLVGAANTGVGFLLFIAFDLTIGTWLDAAVNPVVGSLAVLACAHVLGVLFAFVMYRAFVFKVRGHVLRDLARFESVYLVSIIINAIILPILVSFGWNRILAQFSILIVTTLISYFGHRSFSFRRTPAETEPEPVELMLDPGAAAAVLENHEHDPNTNDPNTNNPNTNNPNTDDPSHNNNDGPTPQKRPPQKPGDT